MRAYMCLRSKRATQWKSIHEVICLSCFLSHLRYLEYHLRVKLTNNRLSQTAKCSMPIHQRTHHRKKNFLRMRKGCTSLVHNLHPIQRYCFSSASISPFSSSPLFLVDVAHTLTNPISCAFSLNACRLMLSPYLRMMPDVFLSPVTTLLAISMWFEVIARQYEEIGEERREEGLQTSRASLCRRLEDGSTRLIRGTCGRLLVGVAGLEGFKV
jgi:hypothetical protein